uniref:Uncharacterized protein n=1 Tax=Lactuca sativa TaxID=4236 RepID=A0A9R1VQP7_LACSA|nr:hypothetical protein LSAT_V11C400189800 [Lactuca sativa]
MQKLSCERRNAGAESKKDVIEYAEKVIDRRINKSSSFWVSQIDQSRYEVMDQTKNGIVNLESLHCTCGKWQLSGIPYVVFPVQVPAEYEERDEVMVVFTPLMDKRQV